MSAAPSDANPHEPQPAAVILSNSGGISLGAYNRIEQVGDLVAGHKIELAFYLGPQRPETAEQHTALEQAYRSEIAARYAAWRARYVPLTMQAAGRAQPAAVLPHYEREELVFAALRQLVAPTAPTDEPAPGPPEPASFTDLRVGLARYGDLLLLGPPGGGKTTALWRLALDLAEAGLRGDAGAALPLFVRLGGLASGQALLDLLQAELAGAALTDTAGREFALPAHRQLAPLVPALLAAGRLVLLWDGLNEVPQTIFAATARALDQFRRSHPGSVAGPRTQSVASCRADDYALLAEQCGGADPLPIQQATIQGLDPTTIRQLVLARLGPEAGARLLDALAAPQQRALAALARTPLLLTMLCEVYAAGGHLPANRGRLLDAFVAQRWAWERERHPAGWVAAERQAAALARLAEHMTANPAGGTVIAWAAARRHLAQAGVAPEQLRALAVRADLLDMLEGGQAVRFSHQLIQEYFAARALQHRLGQAARLRATPLLGWLGALRLKRYAAPGRRTGWEETLLLLAGLEGAGSLADQLVRSFLSRPLQAARLLLAGGEDADPLLLDAVREAALAQIQDRARTPGERIAAGQALGLVGDPRYPVVLAQWRGEPLPAGFGGAGYWCALPAGRYTIGGWEDGAARAEVALTAFWVARYPVTVAQYRAFVDAGGYAPEADRWWTPEGWRRKQKHDLNQPWGWDDSRYTAANQPVIGVTWYEAMAYCAWLSAQLADGLPVGYVVRLPSEAEWEAAASYAPNEPRRAHPWGEDEPTPERAIYEASGLNAAAPVGCCPAGAAACGALDMAGNAWEWCASSYKAYPAQSQIIEKDFTPHGIGYDVPVRGGAYYNVSTDVRCGARDWDGPLNRRVGNGVRVVVAPCSH